MTFRAANLCVLLLIVTLYASTAREYPGSVYIHYPTTQGFLAEEICSTPWNTTGICIPIFDCQPLNDYVKEQKQLTTSLANTLRRLHCGFDGNKPKICCEQMVPVRPTTTTTEKPSNPDTYTDPPDVTGHPNLRLINGDHCGPVTQQKIFGGNKTGVFDFPWMALIGYTTGSRVPEFKCGGTLINKRYVLTAAHCVTELPSNLVLSGVRVGEHDLNTERDCDRGSDGFEIVCAERYQDFTLESVHYHPDYSGKTYKNDVALLRLNGEADFRPQNVRPICLPIGEAATLRVKKVTVTGWGVTENGVRSQDLLQVFLPIFNNEQCAEAYSTKASIWYKHICAGGKRDVDSCGGDSGGPLQAPGTINTNQLRFVQYGIVSFGLKQCGTAGVPGVYTKVTYYMDWILDTIRP